MRFAIKAWILTVATVASGSSSLVQCFQLASTLPRGTQIRSRSSIHASAATTINETSASTNAAITTPTQHHDMTYAEVNHLAFRALQRECKALGLSAVGTTAALRGRLLTHFGLIGKETSMMSVGSEASVPKVAAAEVEVSFILLRIQRLMLVISSSHFIICTCGCGTLNRNSVLPMALPSVTNPIQSMISK